MVRHFQRRKTPVSTVRVTGRGAPGHERHRTKSKKTIRKHGAY
uniref:Uncharacterized protein n=1 Tax=Siphoviridae sp. ct3CA7 TaxID=2823561 RepID=A0A8S5LF95_9CAUD|nr:MAG TPA: hypothetical protein [Siphoviridae sp. ct3CA7]